MFYLIVKRYHMQIWMQILMVYYDHRQGAMCHSHLQRSQRVHLFCGFISTQLCAHESHLRRSVSPSWGWHHDLADVLQHLAWSAQGCSCACHSSSTWGKIRQHHVTKTHLWGSESAKKFWSLSIRSWDLMRKWERTLKGLKRIERKSDTEVKAHKNEQNTTSNQHKQTEETEQRKTKTVRILSLKYSSSLPDQVIAEQFQRAAEDRHMQRAEDREIMEGK